MVHYVLCLQIFAGKYPKMGLYADVLDDIQKLQEKYVSFEVPIVTGNSTMDQVRDPLPVKCKGAPKRKKKALKFVRKCSNYGSTQHDARKCSASIEHLYVPMSQPTSQKDKAKGSKRGISKRKTCSASTDHLPVPHVSASYQKRRGRRIKESEIKGKDLFCKQETYFCACVSEC